MAKLIKSKHGFVTTDQRSFIMSRIRSIDTSPEVIFRKHLWSLGYRYRKNYNKLPGNPDIVFVKQRVAIFIDGEFWHGYKWEEKKPKIKRNKEYWIKKIERNMERDKINNKELFEAGWSVIRFWQNEIKKNIDRCVEKVIELLN